MVVPNEILVPLQSLAFVSLTGALAYEYATDKHIDMMKLLKYCGLVMFLAFYLNILAGGAALFHSITGDYSLTDVARQVRGAQPDYAAASFWTKAIMNCVFPVLGLLADGIKWLVDIFREFCVLLISIAIPVMIGLSAWKIFEYLLSKAIITILWLSMWSLATYGGDVFISHMMEAIFVKVGIDAAVVGMASVGWIALLSAFIFLLLLMIGIYFTAPFALYSLLSGGDMTASFQRAFAGAATGAAAVGGLASKGLSAGGSSPSSALKKKTDHNSSNASGSYKLASPPSMATASVGNGSKPMAGSTAAVAAGVKQTMADHSISVGKK